MTTYGELDLKTLRDECGLHFARHTYSKGQCSCCYGPLDMPSRYWADGRKPRLVGTYGDGASAVRKYDRFTADIPFILFKNADNGTGAILDPNEPVRDLTYVEYAFRSKRQKKHACCMLLEQLGSEYELDVPKDQTKCLIIRHVPDVDGSLKKVERPLAYKKAMKKLKKIRSETKKAS